MAVFRTLLFVLAGAAVGILTLRVLFPLPVGQDIAVSTASPATAATTIGSAAERGVRVRLLLDDNGIAGLDAELRALDDLSNFDVRLFNPFILSRPKLLSFTFDFFRLNRRMHNKSFTADGAATLVGGRNVGDIYFAFGPDMHYIDTDELALSPAAADVSTAFDAYWNGVSAFESAAFASAVTRAVDQVMERAAYALRLSPAEALEWIAQDEGGAQIVYETEPNTTWLDRFTVRVIGVLPAEWMM